MRTMIITIMSMTLVLTGCGSATETEGPYTQPEIEQATERVLEQSWAAQDAEAQELMCWGWHANQESMLDSFFDELDAAIPLTREQAIEFFDGKCS